MFFTAIGWLVKQARAERSTAAPTMLAGLYGAWSTVRDTRRKIAAGEAE